MKGKKTKLIQFLKKCGVPKGCNLRYADLRDANLRDANLRYADLRDADLRDANLRDANLRYADLRDANLRYANLQFANLQDANLRYANLQFADLQDANLRYANLQFADLRDANLSNTRGLPSQIGALKSLFKFTEDGVICYKVFGKYKTPNPNWIIEEGSVIEETVLFNRTVDCACGVNVATKEWLQGVKKSKIWKCLIKYEWLAGVCVPYNMDGKIRAEKVKLLKKEVLEE